MAKMKPRIIERGRPSSDVFALADVKENRRGRRGERMRVVDRHENRRSGLTDQTEQAIGIGLHRSATVAADQVGMRIKQRPLMDPLRILSMAALICSSGKRSVISSRSFKRPWRNRF